MEFRRATQDEAVDEWLVARHEREIVPLLHRRGDFAEARDFLLYDVGGRQRRHRRAGVRLLQRHRVVAVAGRVPQPVRGDVGLDPRLGRVRGQGGRRVEAAGAAVAGPGPGPRRGRPGRPVACVPRAAVVAGVPAVRRGAAGARPARRAAGLRVARVLGAPRAPRPGRGLAAPGRAAGRRRRALARGRAPGPAAGAGPRRAARGDRRAVAGLGLAAGRRGRRRRRGPRAIGPASSSPSPSARPAPSR